MLNRSPQYGSYNRLLPPNPDPKRKESHLPLRCVILSVRVTLSRQLNSLSFRDLLVGNAYISLNPASIHLLDAVKFSNCRGPKKYWSSPGRSAADGNKTSASCTRLAPPVRGAINSSCFVSTRKISSANTERDRLKEKKARTIHLKEGKLLLHTDWSQFVLLSTSNC